MFVKIKDCRWSKGKRVKDVGFDSGVRQSATENYKVHSMKDALLLGLFVLSEWKYMQLEGTYIVMDAKLPYFWSPHDVNMNLSFFVQ